MNLGWYVVILMLLMGTGIVTAIILGVTKKARPQQYLPTDLVSKTLVLNENTNRDRWRTISKRVKHKSVERVPAVSPTTIDMLGEYERGTLAYRSDMRPEQLARYMTHYRSWKRMSRNNMDRCLILEDDTNLGPDNVRDVEKVIKDLDTMEPDWDVLVFSCPHPQKLSMVTPRIGRGEDGNFTLGAYLLRHKGAVKLCHGALPANDTVENHFSGVKDLKWFIAGGILKARPRKVEVKSAFKTSSSARKKKKGEVDWKQVQRRKKTVESSE